MFKDKAACEVEPQSPLRAALINHTQAENKHAQTHPAPSYAVRRFAGGKVITHHKTPGGQQQKEAI